MNHSKPITFCLFGPCGVGKSEIANKLLGENFFSENTDTPLRRETEGKDGKFNDKPVFVVDIPTNEGDLFQMTEYLKNLQNLQAFIFILGFDSMNINQK